MKALGTKTELNKSINGWSNKFIKATLDWAYLKIILQLLKKIKRNFLFPPEPPEVEYVSADEKYVGNC